MCVARLTFDRLLTHMFFFSSSFSPANNDNFAFSVSRKGHANNTYHWPFTVTPSNTTGGFYYVVFGPADKRGTFQVDVRLIAPTLEPLQASPYTVQVKWGPCDLLFISFFPLSLTG